MGIALGDPQLDHKAEVHDETQKHQSPKERLQRAQNRRHQCSQGEDEAEDPGKANTLKPR